MNELILVLSDFYDDNMCISCAARIVVHLKFAVNIIKEGDSCCDDDADAGLIRGRLKELLNKYIRRK
jgi:hypothetical protein